MNKSAVMAAVFWFASSVPCLAQFDDDVEDYSDETMNGRYDWIITADTKTLKNFLNYPTSGLYPVGAVRINYRTSPRLKREHSGETVRYEELWYHDCKPIGCRKYHELEIESGEQGAIRYRPSSDAAQNHCAIANSIVRLMLDVSLNSAMLSTVSIPQDTFDSVVSDLGQFKFFPVEIKPDTGIRATMKLILTSEPKGRSASLFYSSN